MALSEKNGLLRQQIALEAARIMADQGSSYSLTKARQKAAQRLGCRDKHSLPSQDEIEQALREYQQLFHGDRQPAALQELRILAVEAMASLARFNPRLVGPVLHGTADRYSKVQLHLFAETTEELALLLIEMNIPWLDGERQFRYPGGKKKTLPTFCFTAGETEIELALFPPEGLHQSPLRALDDKPEQRASIDQVKTLIKQDQSQIKPLIF